MEGQVPHQRRTGRDPDPDPEVRRAFDALTDGVRATVGRPDAGPVFTRVRRRQQRRMTGLAAAGIVLAVGGVGAADLVDRFDTAPPPASTTQRPTSGPGTPTASGPSGPSAAATSPSAVPDESGSGQPDAPSEGDRSTPTGSSLAIGRCHTAGLSVTMTEDSGAAASGRSGGWLTLANISGGRCRVYGYPGLQLVNADGAAIPTTVRRAVTTRGGPPVLVTLAPGGKAYAWLTWDAQPDVDEPQQGVCQPLPAKIKVIPPDETTQVSADWSSDPVCRHGAFSVDAFQAGATPSG
jgi:hypothetical protein